MQEQVRCAFVVSHHKPGIVASAAIAQKTVPKPPSVSEVAEAFGHDKEPRIFWGTKVPGAVYAVPTASRTDATKVYAALNQIGGWCGSEAERSNPKRIKTRVRVKAAKPRCRLSSITVQKMEEQNLGRLGEIYFVDRNLLIGGAQALSLIHISASYLGGVVPVESCEAAAFLEPGAQALSLIHIFSAEGRPSRLGNF